MKKQFKIGAAAVAVAAAFAAPTAFAGTIVGAGASAVNTSLLGAIILDYCGANATNTAGATPTVTVDYYDNAAAQTTLAKGGVWMVKCANPSTIAGVTFNLTLTSNPIQISYDTTGGSWKSFATTTPAIESAGLLDVASWVGAGAAGTDADAPYTIDLTSAPAGVAEVVTSPSNLAGITVQYHANSGLVVANGSTQNTVTGNYTAGGALAASVATTTGTTSTPLNTNTDIPTFGLSDVETKLFAAATVNQPTVWNGWAQAGAAPVQLMSYFGPASSGASSAFTPATEAAGFPKAAFGVVFGVAASGPLWLAMQQDQLNSGVLPTALCGTVAAGNLASPYCVPVISREQYASLVSQSGGALLQTANGLFQTAGFQTGAAVEVARRDQGSGTQGSSNATFLNAPCGTLESTNAVMLPWLTVADGGGDTNPSTYSLSTGDVISRLQGVQPSDGTTVYSGGGSGTYPASGYAIGVVSGEKYSATSITGTGAVGSGTAPWGFLRLDGFLPTNANLSGGLYNYTTTEQFHCSSAATGDALQLCKDLTTAANTHSLQAYSVTDPAGIYPVASNAAADGNYFTNSTTCNGPRHH